MVLEVVLEVLEIVLEVLEVVLVVLEVVLVVLEVVLVVLEVHENKTLLVFPRGWEGENADRVKINFPGLIFG